MSTSCTLTGERTERTHGLVDTVEPCLFDGESHELLHGLKTDVDKAHACIRPLFGFIRRRGHIRFVILPEGSSLVQHYKKAGFHVSAIKLDADAMSKSAIESTTRRIAQQGVGRIKEMRIARISNLEWHWCVDGASITFEVDLEAA